MSSEGPHRRRCIIKKLDFENCIVTNIKTNARGRKKLRARITREIGHYPETVQSQEENPPAGRTSPVLISRQPNATSPVLLKRKKITVEGKSDRPDDSQIEETPSPSSPVFKFFKKNKILNESSGEFRVESLREEGQGSDVESSYQIEDTTTQESKESVKISSVDSGGIKNSSSSVYSIQESSAVARKDSDIAGSSSTPQEKYESPRMSKRTYKKNSLLGRLHKLQQKQASEKLLWQHQNRGISSACLRFSVISFWNEEFNFYLKCRSLSEDPAVTFLIVDSRWVPTLKTVKETSVLQLYPPWQKLTVDGSGTTVLINVICLEVLDESEETIAGKRTFEGVPAAEFETNDKLFIDSLFRSNDFGFLC